MPAKKTLSQCGFLDEIGTRSENSCVFSRHSSECRSSGGPSPLRQWSYGLLDWCRCPVGFYTSLGGGRSAGGRRVGSPSATSYQRQLAAQQRHSAFAEKAAVARALSDELLRILNLHRVEFTPATPPVVPAPAQPDRGAIYNHYEEKALAGLSLFNRRGRKEARQRARVWADGDVRRRLDEASQTHAEAQAYFDHRWQQLCNNVPDVVIETLDEAIEDNEAPSAAVGVDGEVALVVLVPDVDGAIPDRMPTTTQAGNLSLK
jgi:hypothetical protein